MPLLNVWPAVLAGITFASFAWGLRGHFRLASDMPMMMKLLSACSLVVFCGFLVGLRYVHPSVADLSTAAAFFVAALAIFWWAVMATRHSRPHVAHTDALPFQILTVGPYRIVRHPFYLAYILFWIGLAVVIGTWQWVGAFLFIVWYAYLAHSEERRFVLSDFGETYRAYQSRSRMFIPLPRLSK